MISPPAVAAFLDQSRDLLGRGFVDRRIYSDPDLYELELRRVFAKSWCLVGLESQVRDPGQFFESYIGEDAVLVTRDRQGQVKVMLNSCPHRGNKVCRAETGKAHSFMCQYHGWTFNAAGEFVSAPGFDEHYQQDIRKEDWGLAQARVGLYGGLIFATFDDEIGSLDDFLGDFRWLLDVQLRRYPSELELAGGMIRWNIRMNWKLCAENGAGDLYHGRITHRSAMDVGHSAITNDSANAAGVPLEAFTIVANGHAGNVDYAVEPRDPFESVPPSPLSEHMKRSLGDMQRRLGTFRSHQVRRYNANVFPNASFHTSADTIHILHPRGVGETEVWMLCLVDPNAPDDVKRYVRRESDHHFGPAGFFEEDDGENWEQATRATRGVMAERLPFNMKMGHGRRETFRVGDSPELIRGGYNEYGQTAFLERWHELMLEESGTIVAPRCGTSTSVST
ncbi:MAG TPA: SRPBCC family protein [Ilumatobacter sp.]|nr:SRPBCC family protein [Ilumatobacter sp.]